MTDSPITEVQCQEIEALIEDRDVFSEHYRASGMTPEQWKANLMDTVRGLSVADAERWRQRLRSMPIMPRPEQSEVVAAAADIPAGRYAVMHNGVLKFWKLDKPTKGRWAGHVFLKVQASDDQHNIRSRRTVLAVLKAIAEATPEEAQKRYGHELGRCGNCGRTLTDRVSRYNGIGPVCADNLGYALAEPPEDFDQEGN